MKRPAVYMMASQRNGTLYTGVTSHIEKRAFEHRTSEIKGFSSKYGCHMLVYYEFYDDMQTAIAREKQIKSGSRAKKLVLIESMNPLWHDLYNDLTK